jgi:predicted Holliday junction resolvase-like endonuclease
MNTLVAILSLVIIFMAIIIFKLNRKLRFLKVQFSGKTNGLSGKDLFENITKSKTLYKDLLIEFHPDKFILDENRKKRAEELSSQIAESKASYRDLILIAQRVKNEFQFSSKFINNYPEIFK